MLSAAELRTALKRRKIALVPVDRGTSFYDPERDGVTFSVLNGWLQCREQARLSLTGTTPRFSGFGATFGAIIHELLDRAYSSVRSRRQPPSAHWVKMELARLEAQWAEENPLPDDTSKQHMELTVLVGEALMPLYFQHWEMDFSRTWTKVEHEFKIPLELTHVNGKTYRTFLRGKMDGAFLVGSKGARTRLFETKTKSWMDQEALSDIITFELQLHIYLYSLLKLEKRMPLGVLYNLIRRPGLRPKKNESLPAFAKRIAADIRKRPDWYFTRMELNVTPADIHRFEGRLFDMVGDFVAWWRGDVGHYLNSGNCQNKFGTCWALPICSRGEYGHTFQRETVFRELAEVL
jgi:hypothetical protein